MMAFIIRPAFVLLMSLAVIGWIVPTHQTNPGLQMRLSQSGLNYAAGVAIEQMTDEIQGKRISDISGNSRVAVGNVEYSLSGIAVRSFGSPTSRVVVNPGNGITWSLTGMSASIHGDWRYKYKWGWIKIRDHGSFDVSTSGARLTVSISMGVDSSGRPTIRSTSCSSDGGSVRVRFHGGASWLYNLFRKSVETPLKREIQKLLCSASQKAINDQGAKQLAKLKVQVEVDNLGVLDYRLVEAPVFGSQYVEAHHKGEFFLTGDSTEAPFQPSPLPAPPGSSKMLSIGVSQYVLDTAGYATFQRGLLQNVLTKDNLPQSAADMLQVTCSSGLCIGAIFPQLVQLFRTGWVEISTRATEQPRLYINPGSVIGGFVAQSVFNVRMPNNELNHAFTVTVAANMTLSVAMNDRRITASVASFTNSFTIENTVIGTLQASGLEYVFNIMFRSFIKPNLDEQGAKGLVLPSIDDVAYVNPTLTLTTGALYLQTDVRYSP